MFKQMKDFIKGFMTGFRAASDNKFEKSIVDSQSYEVNEMFDFIEIKLMNLYLNKMFSKDIYELTKNITWRRHLATENGYGGLYIPSKNVISISNTCSSLFVGRIDSDVRMAYTIHELTHVVQNSRKGLMAKIEMIKTIWNNIKFKTGAQAAYFQDKLEMEAFDHQKKFSKFINQYLELNDQIDHCEDMIYEYKKLHGENYCRVVELKAELAAYNKQLDELLN